MGNVYKIYEREKKKLQAMNLPQKEYDAAIRNLIEKLKI